MADRNLSGPPPPALSAPSHLNGSIGGTAPKHSPPPHHNGGPEAGPRSRSPSSTSTVPQPHSATSSSRTSASTSPLRSPVPGPGPEDRSPRPRFQSFTSALNSRTRSTTSRAKRRSSQQEEPEALLDLILECQGQRLEDQRASLSLLPDPGPAALCGACSPDQSSRPTLDFYCMLIHYQSDRMEDQRCSLPDLDDVVGSVPDGQEDFLSLIQRVQSRRMDEQRASLPLTHTEDDHDTYTAGSSPRHHHHHQ